MSEIKYIREQIAFTDQWTYRMLDKLDADLWNETPAGLGTNINWLVGHILISKSFHCLLSIQGSTPELKTALPAAREYQKYYGMKTDPTANMESKPGKETLLSELRVLDGLVESMLLEMPESALLETPVFPNPVARNKGDALRFSYKHQMWHGGQIAMIKRVLQTAD